MLSEVTIQERTFKRLGFGFGGGVWGRAFVDRVGNLIERSNASLYNYRQAQSIDDHR